MYLYPRLPTHIASLRTKKYCSNSIDDLRKQSGLKHSAASYAPTGGNRVNEELLGQIQHKVRVLAGENGYPNRITLADRQLFDAQCAILLYEKMDITPSEAANLGVWAFMTCVLLPDIVRWRFPGNKAKTHSERFIGSRSGWRRNTFGRLWWRAYLLRLPQEDDPYRLLYALNEDELVQITERPSLAGSPMLARQIGISFLQIIELSIPRKELMRDGVKRIRRLLPILSFDLLDGNMLQHIIDETFEHSVKSLSQQSPNSGQNSQSAAKSGVPS